jgi:hypothetical protein
MIWLLNTYQSSPNTRLGMPLNVMEIPDHLRHNISLPNSPCGTRANAFGQLHQKASASLLRKFSAI